MIYDINQELRDYIYITNLYKCISNYNLMGHQIGRKIGDMLEIITMGTVYRTPNLCKALDTEGKLEGFTSAGHKVEFGFFKDLAHKKDLFGAIECKCVGVEETKLGKKNTVKLKPHDSFDMKISGHWMSNPLTVSFTLEQLYPDKAALSIQTDSGINLDPVTLEQDDNIKVVVDENENFYITSPHGDMLQEVPGIIRILRTIKVTRIEKDSCTLSLFSCLTGPQTIEKAKQASLVAMDLRRKIDGSWGKEDISPDSRKMTFVHVLCEFSHWEAKSRNVIKTCIDHNLIVPDDVLIYAFKKFEEKFGTDRMLDYISKKQFDESSNVRNTIYEILDHYENHVLYDIELNKYVWFDNVENALRIIPID